ncbi:hypothetical protein EJB05_22747, partial [Eragrostis curvula]
MDYCSAEMDYLSRTILGVRFPPFPNPHQLSTPLPQRENPKQSIAGARGGGRSLAMPLSFSLCGGNPSRSSSAIVVDNARGRHDLKIDAMSFAAGALAAPLGFVTSSAFTVGGHQWRIRYYPHGDRAESAGHVSLFLELDEEEGGAAVHPRVGDPRRVLPQQEEGGEVHATELGPLQQPAENLGLPKIHQNGRLAECVGSQERFHHHLHVE